MAQPRNLFTELGIDVKPQQQAMKQPRNLFTELGITPSSRKPLAPPFMQLPESRYPEFQKSMRQAGAEAQPGFAQNYANSLIGIANLLPKVNIPEINIAPNTSVAQQAGMGGTLASYLGPRGVAKLATGMYNPRNIAKFERYMESRPVQEFLLRNLGAGTEAGLFSAAHAPQGQKLEEGGKGAALGSAIDVLGRMTGVPYLGQAARTGLGYLAGQQVGHPYYGAMIGGTAPNLVKSFFPASKNAIIEEMIGGLNPRDVSRVGSAADRLGIRVRPSEASGNPIQALVEAQPRKTIMGAREHIKQEVGREHEQQNAIRNFLNRIYEPTPENEKKINALYKKAYAGKLELPQLNEVVEMPLEKSPILNKSGVNFEKEVPPKLVNKTMEYLKSGPILKEAFGNVGRNSAFAEIPENNYERLHAVSRELERMKKGARDGNEAYKIGQVQENFNKLIKTANPDFAKAQEAAAPKMQRRQIEEKINEDIEGEKVTGRDFYNKVLKNYKGYKELQRSLKNNPQARESLKNMRIVFKNLSKLPTVGTTAESAAKGYTSPRDFMNTLVNNMRDIAGAKTDVAKIKYINSGQWRKDFDKLQEIKDARKYQRELLNLIGRVGVAYGLTPESAENFKKAISE